MATRYEYYITNDDTERWFYTSWWAAQTFTPSVAHKITSVKLLLLRYGSPGTLTVCIQGVDGSGHPDGSDLCSGTTNCNTLPTGSPYEWREITLGAGTNLDANTQYAIVVKALNADEDNRPGWRYDQTSATYPGGDREFTNDSGSTWYTYSGEDFMFEDWGEPLIVELAGVAAGVCSVSGLTVITYGLAGVSAGVASVSGAIARTLALAGASSGVATAAATLTNQKWLAGIATGKAVVIGVLTNQKWLAGVVAGKAVVSATLINIKWLAGVIAGVATVSANLFHVRVAIRVLSAVRNLLALRNIPPVR